MQWPGSMVELLFSLAFLLHDAQRVPGVIQWPHSLDSWDASLLPNSQMIAFTLISMAMMALGLLEFFVLTPNHAIFMLS